MPQPTDDETRIRALSLLAQGRRQYEVAATVGVSRWTLRRWAERYAADIAALRQIQAIEVADRAVRTLQPMVTQ